MPYIEQKDRERLQNGEKPEAPGDLAYLIYCLTVAWVYEQTGSISYTRASAAIGVLDTAKDEFRRQHLDPYEDGKIRQNGNVGIEEAFTVARRIRDGLVGDR